MLFYKTKPNSKEKKEIFYHDSRLIIGFGILGTLAQFWSGFTEFIGLNGYLIDLCSFYLPNGWAKLIGNSIAFGIALTIEISTFALVTYIVNSFYNGYLKFTNPKDLNKNQISNWIKFIVASSVLILIIWISSTVSKKNVEHSTQASPPKAKIESTQPFTIEQKEQIAAIEKRYNEDRIQEVNSYEENKNLVQNQFNVRVTDKKASIADYERLEQQTNKKYYTLKKKLRTQIRGLEITKSDSLKGLKGNHDYKLQQLILTRNYQTEKTKTEINQDKSVVVARNNKIETATNKRNAWLSLFLRQYAQFSVFIFLFARVWVCISLNTCGIRPKVLVKPEFFESGILKDFFTLAYTYPTRRLHNAIRRKLAIIPDLIPIKEKGALIKLDHPINSENNAAFIAASLPPITQNLTTHENRIYETQKEFLRKCEHCKNDFVPNHKKHRFCSTDCRKKAWEEKTGRTLKLKAKKS